MVPEHPGAQTDRSDLYRQLHGGKWHKHKGARWAKVPRGPKPAKDSGGLGSCETHHVDFSPQEDCGGAKGTLGEGEGGAEEGGLEPGSQSLASFWIATLQKSIGSFAAFGRCRL